MKALGHIVLSLWLLLSTIGVAVEKHYCLSTLRSVSLFTEFDEDDCCGVMEDRVDGCCDDEYSYEHLDEDFSPSGFEFKLPSLVALTAFHYVDFSEFIIQRIQEVPELDIPPPKPIRLHLLYAVLLN